MPSNHQLTPKLKSLRLSGILETLELRTQQAITEQAARTGRPRGSSAVSPSARQTSAFPRVCTMSAVRGRWRITPGSGR
jgi:hypothetical protein